MAGAAAAALVLPFAPGVAAAAEGDPATWSFDFGTPSSPVAEGYQGVDESTAYSEEAGFGITSGSPASRDRSTDVDPMTGDFVLGDAWEFAVDVPNGTYEVEVWTGDTLAGTSSVRTTVAPEGGEGTNITADAEQTSSGTLTAEVADGQLNLGITGKGYGYVNGLVITEVPDDGSGDGGDDGGDDGSGDSGDDGGTTTGAAGPANVRIAHATGDEIVVRWNEVAGATGYVLTRSDAVDGEYTEIARTGSREVFFADTDVDTSAVHYYRALAVTDEGTTEPSAPVVSTLAAEPTFPEDGTLQIDLGSGAVADGAVGVDADTAYTAENRLGFVDASVVTATDNGGANALRGDFVTTDGGQLVVDLPNGDYTVDLVAGDAEGATDIAITAEQMAKVQQTERAAGEYLEMQFDIALVDSQLNLDVTGSAANLNALTITRADAREAGDQPTVFVTGDSTVQTYDPYWAPQAGWGQMIERYLSDDVVVDNHAIGGRSSKNFISQGRLDTVLKQIKPGDYLYVQFGHNDNSYGVDDRWAAPGDYYWYLHTFVEGAVQRGAQPIIVTPVSRRSFDADTGQFNVSFPDYVQAATDVAAATGAPLVDLSASSRAYLDEIGPEAAKSVFLHVPAGVYPNRPDGTTDDTHFQEYGAIQMARLVALDTAELDVPLAEQVVDAEPPADVPAAPAGVVAGSVSASSATLTWTEVEGADIYKVFAKASADGDDAYELVTTSTIGVADVTGLEAGTSYDLQVVAVNGAGDSAPSATVTIETKAPLFKFDVQLAGNPTKDGYTAFDQNTLYTEELGYGFTSDAGPGGRDRGTGDGALDDLQRDFLLPGSGNPMRFDVPNGTYAVEVVWGDLIGTARLGVTIEGTDYGSSNAGRGSTSSKIVQPVVVTDGTIDVVAEGWLNGLEITALLYAPTELVAGDVSIDGSAVEVPLSWQPAEDVAGYRVYRLADGAAEPTALGDVASSVTEFVDTTADVGLQYTYTVVALDDAGNESVASNALELTTVDPDVPTAAAPSGLAVTDVAKNEVSLTWEAVEDALFYHVYREDEAGDLVLIDRAAEPAYTDTDVLTTIGYTYAVASVNAGGVSELSGTVISDAVTNLSRQAERIGRQPVAAQSADGVYVGWRMLGDDPESIGFHVYRDGSRITDEPITGSTNLVDADGSADSTYRVASVVDGVERWATDELSVWDAQTLDIPLNKPEDAYTKDGQPYTYSANDASVADLDGDGEYEYVVKWYPSNAQDNSRGGYTGNTYLDAYELDGTQLWRIDLGINIRSGAHYTQFQVFDYDGDGKAEVAMKTADGTTDGAGTVIGDARADFRTSGGYVLSGPEYLTVFDGESGVALDTIDYVPPRGDVGSWGDTYGNRVDRFLAGTAYLDGEQPSMLFARGYYTRTVVAAFDWDGTELSQRWVFDSDVAGDEYRGQGNHSLAVADVDGDQKDEILYGSMTLDDDGTVLYNTGLGHGDAQHVSDFDPSRAGQEVFSAHEDIGRSEGRGATFRDAATGEIIWSIPAEVDTGRAAMGDIDPRYDGAEGWAVGGDAAWDSPVGQLMSSLGELIAESIPAANFLTFWDGDLLTEIGDHDWDADTSTGVPTISKWDYENVEEVEIYRAEGTLSNNSTKGTPALQADLFGDWREEIVTRTEDSTALRVATTVIPTEHRLRTLMSDSQYRVAVAWQNTGYNQPPHTSYFIGEGMETPDAPRLAYTTDADAGEVVVDEAPAHVKLKVKKAGPGRAR
ncbi:fibronectin type 3 domain-containing protein [Isoptericola sp. CG 20/1183]|uniref:Fibronectin type 3 domain-containing protein n=1 Tax=Isoptericola halotolerans TaxID=300560 RepID=A0ABX5EM48_9MICO|nr:fibronectin type III domain-containing protein [Isoptericola halotolerans]PRZ09588.1 fibronectin type 3 domain-containing protein [Isoptericola sp. CG 20/1183]PRZ10389.1 fibronectin type 3 domain-containing protein [Isoptericola halotolerans]